MTQYCCILLQSQTLLQMQVQDLIAVFSAKLKDQNIQENDLKQLRRLCTQGIQKQTMIANEIIHSLPLVLRIVIQKCLKGRDQKIESFFLQLMSNMITGNLQKSKQLYEAINQIPLETTCQITRLFKNTIKNQRLMLIFIHNFLFQLQKVISWDEIVTKKLIIQFIRFALADIHEQQQTTFQWRTFIFVLLFIWQKHDAASTIQFLINTLTNPHDLLTMLSILLEKVIDSKTTASLVKYYMPQIEHIVEMYKPKQNSISFLLNHADVQFLFSKFTEQYQKFRQLIVASMQPSCDKKKELQFHFDYLNDILSILGHILFLGGYNKKVQQLLSSIVPEVCSYFQLIFLMFSLSDKQFNERKLTIPMQQKSHLQQEALLNLLGIESKLNSGFLQQIYESLYTIEMFALALKFLTNYIHLNRQGIVIFQKRKQYLYMIMELTKISSTQPTMRQWSIMFIRNSCEISEVIQKTIEYLKFQVKQQ